MTAERLGRVSLLTGRHKSTSYEFFFFFQAEDGIRDYKVTGVQTCALPIWRAAPRLCELQVLPLYAARLGVDAARHHRDVLAGRHDRHPGADEVQLPAGHRSEERRVGEEGRSRWSPYH